MSAALEIRGLSVAIAGAPILTDVALTVAQGASVGLIGRNGAGKTTLMRAVMGLLPALGGQVTLAGADLLKLPPQARAGLGIGYMPEDRRLIPELTVEENIHVPAWATGQQDMEERISLAYEILPEVKDFGPRKALQLSGGQQKMVALARALVCGTKLLLLDEPFEGVAPALAQRLAAAISALRDSGVAVLLSESDYVHSADLVDAIYVIERGIVSEREMAAV
jgi:branched-chain amino acid transport system ATP-binding protein